MALRGAPTPMIREGAELAARSADADLVRRAQQGEADAFDALVRSRLTRCYRIAWSILLNEADAADAVQDAFVLAWRDLTRLREPAAFDGWLNRVVVNAARTGRRRRTRLHEVTVAVVADPPPQHGAPLGDPSDIRQVADADAIGRAFDRLTADQRAILILHHVEEQPVGLIARSLGIPEGTVKSRLHTARRALDAALEAEA
jgi:RNA polymerase sigma-70 factor (ECF subfamily)